MKSQLHAVKFLPRNLDVLFAQWVHLAALNYDQQSHVRLIESLCFTLKEGKSFLFSHAATL